jgi:Zn-dependent membrane protease YugP
VFFSLAVFFQLVTLPVEYNASARAMAALENSGTMNSEELTASGKVLKAAALTYVAALAVALLNLLRLIMIASGARRR